MKNQDETLVEFQIGDLVPIGLALIVSGLILAYGLSIVSDTRNSGVQKCDNSSWTYNESDGQCCGVVKSISPCCNETTGTTAAYNGTRSIGESLANITTKIPTIATIVIAAIVIGILLKYFGGMGRSE